MLRKFFSAAFICLSIACVGALLAPGCDDYETGGGVNVSRGGPDNSASVRVRRRGERDMIEETKREIERLQRQPVPAGHVKVTITRLDVEERDRSLVNWMASYRDSSLAVHGGALGGRNGFTVYGARHNLLGALAGRMRSSRSAERSEQYIVILPGYTGQFESVRKRTLAWTTVIPIWRGAVLVQTLETRITGSGMTVRVGRASPDAVELELMPYFHGAERRGRQELTELRTTLRLKPGAPYVIASSNTQRQSAAQALFSYRKKNEKRQVAHVIRVDIGQ